MSKFTIDLTKAEKRRMWKAGLSLRKLENYSLRQVLDAVRPDLEREKQIRRQFYAYGNDGELEKGLSAIVAFSKEYDPLRGTTLGMSRGIKTTIDMLNKTEKMLPRGLSSVLNSMERSTSPLKNLRADTFNTLDLARSLSPTAYKSVLDSVASSRSVLDSLKPISERMSQLSAGASMFERFKSPDLSLKNIGLTSALEPKAYKTILDSVVSSRSVLDSYKPISERFVDLTAGLSNSRLSSFSNSVYSIDRLMNAQTKEFSRSLLQQDVFKNLEIGALAKLLATTSVFEKTHLSSVATALSAATSYTKLAEVSLGAFQWENIGKRVSLSDIAIQQTQNKFIDMSASYSNLLRSISEKPNWIYEAPETAKIPSQDYYVASRILEIVSADEPDSVVADEQDEEIISGNKDAIGRYLPMVDSDLPNVWSGALLAMQSNNPDKNRHMITSLRELYTHVLHLLAPDDAIAKWDENKEHYHNGKPTRRGRFLYLCRNVNGSDSPFAKLLKAEIDATLAMIDIFQGGTHSIKSKFSALELEFIKIKADTTLRTFLMLEFEINRR